MAATIDKLPQVTRQKVIDALLAGESLRAVAEIAGVSHTQVAMYKRKVFLPTLQASQKLNAVNELAKSTECQVREASNLTRAALAAGPLLERIAKHQQTTDAAIADARVVKDARGVSSLIGTDFKGMELQARLLGLLDDSAKIQNNVQIVVPGSVPVATGPGRIEDGDIIDITPAEG